MIKRYLYIFLSFILAASQPVSLSASQPVSLSASQPVSLSASQPAIHGSVRAAQDSSAIDIATVCLWRDSTIVMGTQTDSAGRFILTDIPHGTYYLEASYIGYITDKQLIQLADSVYNVTFFLNEDIQTLGEVEVRGKVAEMVVKGDTLEYNTAAYKVQAGANVEALLKRMSGVEVDKEGNVTVNGETVQSVRVDGKNFFGDDVQAATKNIPADMIDRVQVYDEKSEMAQLTGFDDDEGKRIINLRLKEDRKQGVLGNYTGGLGTDLVAQPALRYNAHLFTNIFKNNTQTTIIGGANNINEIISGQTRGLAGGQSTGITRAENISVNTNIDCGKGVLFGGDALLNHSDNNGIIESHKQSFGNGATYTNHDATTLHGAGWGTSLRLEVEYAVDSLNQLVFRPELSYTDSRNDSYNEFLNQNDSDTISNGFQQRSSLARNITSSLDILYNHKFLRPGRSFTLDTHIDYTSNHDRGHTHAQDNSSDSVLVHHFSNDQNNTLSYGIKASYVEPVYHNNHLLEMSLSLNVRNQRNDKQQYRDSLLTVLDSAFSNHLRNDFYSEALELNYRWLEAKTDLLVGIRLNPSQTHSYSEYGNRLLTRDTTISVWNISPNVNFKYKFGKRDFARFIYRGATQQPSINQIEPVRNNSDAMHETVGNLHLKPAFQHTWRFLYSKFFTTTMASLMAGMNGALTKDALANNSVYDEKGKLYQQTVNAQHIPWNIGANLMFNTPFAHNHLQFNTQTTIQYNQRVAYILRAQRAEDITQALILQTLPIGDGSLTGNLTARQSLGLRFTHDVVDVGVRGNVNYSRTQNNINPDKVGNVLDWNIVGDVELRLPKDWTITADCGYTARYGYQLSDVNEVLLNARITKAWKNAILTLEGRDLLNSRKNIVQTVGENFVEYQKINTLTTYIMLNFTYRLNQFSQAL